MADRSYLPAADPTARIATPYDRAAVIALLARTWRRHGNLALDDQWALLQNGYSTLAFTRDTLSGFLGLAPRAGAGPQQEVWIDVPLLGIAPEANPAKTLRSLLTPARAQAQAVAMTGLVCLTQQRWLCEGLQDAGFAQADQVLTLIHDEPPAAAPGSGAVQLWPATMAHAEAILALNAAAFEPFWRYDDATLISWLLTADHARVAYRDTTPVGFALTTRGPHDQYAHLIRVVTHPAWQGVGIGRQLVCDALDYARRNRLGLALNTQASNRASRHMYASLGFHAVPDPLAVLALRLA